MREELKKFLEEVSKNEELKQKLKALNEMEKEKAIEAIITFAKEAGYTLVPEDFEEKTPERELTDEEVEAVSGGKKYNFDETTCYCFLGGGGGGTDSSDGEIFGCGCVAYGEGGCRGEDGLLSCDCIGIGVGTTMPGEGIVSELKKLAK